MPRITASDCKNPVSSSYCGFVSLLFSEALAPVLVVLFLGVCADFCVVFDVVFVLADACDCFVVSFCFLVPAKCFSPFNVCICQKMSMYLKNVKAVVKLIQCQKQISPFNKPLRLEQSLTASNFKHTRIPILHHNLLYRFLSAFICLFYLFQMQFSDRSVQQQFIIKKRF